MGDSKAIREKECCDMPYLRHPFDLVMFEQDLARKGPKVKATKPSSGSASVQNYFFAAVKSQSQTIT